MTHKTTLLIAAVVTVLVFFGATVQAKTYEISVSQFVEHPALDAVLQGFQDAVAEAGIEVDYNVHNAQANTAITGQIAQQIAGERPDLVLAIATPTAQACAQVTKKAPHMAKTPLLFSAVTDPVGSGLVDNLEHPGGNITGTSDLTPIGKHLDLIRTIQPELKTVGVIYNAGEANSKTLVGLVRDEGQKRGIAVEEATAARSSEVYQAAKSLVGVADAVYVPTDNTIVSAFESVTKVCLDNDLPLYAADVDSVPRGAIAALGFDYYKHGRQTGNMAVRILRGADPGQTPVEMQKDLELHLNLESAQAIGVEIPQKLKDQAAKIYE